MEKNHQVSTKNTGKGEQITMDFMENNFFEEEKVITYPEKTPKKRGRKSKAELAAMQAAKEPKQPRTILGVEEIESLANEIKTEFNITPDNPPKSTKDNKKRGRKKGKKNTKKETSSVVRHTIKKSVIERIKEFVQICPKVPSQFVYYVGIPNENERETFGLDKNLTFAKLIIWDGEANFAFTVGDVEVFEVENIIPNDSKIIKGEQAWSLHQYRSKPNFLEIAENQCKGKGKEIDIRDDLANMRDIHNDIFKNHTTLYESLVIYQDLLNKVMAENIEIYNTSKQDFMECQVAVERIKQFLTTLKD